MRPMFTVVFTLFLACGGSDSNPTKSETPEPPAPPVTPSPSIIGIWILTGTNLERIVEKINMNLVAAGEEPDPFLEFAAELLEAFFSEGMTFKFESSGVFTQSYQDLESQGTWSQSGNMIMVSFLSTDGASEEQTFVFSVDGNRLTLTVESGRFEYTLPADSDLAIEEVLKDVPDLSFI